MRKELVECCFTSTETIGLLGTGAQDSHLDFHTAPELCGGVEGGGGDIIQAYLIGATLSPPEFALI